MYFSNCTVPDFRDRWCRMVEWTIQEIMQKPTNPTLIRVLPLIRSIFTYYMKIKGLRYSVLLLGYLM